MTIYIPQDRILWVFACLTLFFQGFDTFAEPLADLIRRKKFILEDAIAKTLAGVTLMIIGAILLGIVLTI